jgi:hypothetical protein
VLVAALCVAAPAAAQVVTLRAFPGPRLVQGPELAGERLAWAQTRCVEDCNPDLTSEADERYEVRSLIPYGLAPRIFRGTIDRAFSGPNFSTESYSFLLSEQVLATMHLTLRGDELDGESGGAELRAGPPGTPGDLLVDCSVGFFAFAAPVALDGSRLAYDPDPCDGFARLVVRDLSTGETLSLPEPAGGVHLRLRGRFVAWVASERLVVHDLTTGTRAYSAPARRVLDLDLDADGSVAAVAGRAHRPCRSGRLLRYSLVAPSPVEVDVPTCATGVRVDAGRIAFMGWDGATRTLRALGPGGETEDLVQFGRVRPGAFDIEGDGIAWAARACSGGEAMFSGGVGQAPLGVGPLNCPVRFLSDLVRVRRGVAVVRLGCPRGCGGELSLRRMGTRGFSLRSREREVEIRLRARGRARLERLGSLEALAKVVTFNRAGERRVERRGVRLVAR